jgi:hypothetical protein
LFILSSGRSGSTLLQRVLNTYDDVTIWGEHAGFLAPTAEAYFRLIENPGSREFLFPGSAGRPIENLAQLAERKDPRQWQAWVNSFTPDDAATFFRRHVESFLKLPLMDDGHVWGFKEIRYGRGDRVIEFLATLYPRAVFVFLGRHALSTLASQFKAFQRGGRLGRLWPRRGLIDACRKWKLQNQTLLDWHRSGRLRSFWIPFEELSQGGAALAPLLAELGKKLGPEQEAVFGLDEGRGSAFGSSNGLDQRWKTFGYLPLAVAEAIVGEVNASLGYEAPPSLRWLGKLRRRGTSPRRSSGLAGTATWAPPGPG